MCGVGHSLPDRANHGRGVAHADHGADEEDAHLRHGASILKAQSFDLVEQGTLIFEFFEFARASTPARGALVASPPHFRLSGVDARNASALARTPAPMPG